MAESALNPDWFSKPGDTLQALMAKRDMDLGQLSITADLETTTLRGLLSGIKAIDSGIAEKLAATVGGSPSFWLKRQSTYEKSLEKAANSLSPDAASVWLQQFPVSDLHKYGWVRRPDRRQDLLQAYLAFFSVNSPEDWRRRYEKAIGECVFRTSPSYAMKVGALSAWLRQAEVQASAISSGKWDGAALRARLPELRRLTRRNSPAEFLPRMKALCLEAGVVVTLVRAPPGCRASGATRVLSSGSALIALSARYLSDDHFWFTFFHEVGHLLLHANGETFVDIDDADTPDEIEKEANSFSSSTLIPNELRPALRTLRPKMVSIIRFAKDAGVSPGIVVGQLQHEGVIGPQQMNFLKRRFKWEELEAADQPVK